jgi:hypothetical protein
VRFECSHCRGILEIADCEPGEAVACGHCNSAVTVPETRFSPGAVIGDFVLRKELGKGGMGTVYLAHQVSLDRDAAVKVLLEEFAADEEYVESFIREARAAAHLNHPGIVQAYAVGEADGVYYFAMEYVEGSTLGQALVHSGRMVPERALAIITDVAEALDFGWRNQQLVHRDLKPENIMLTSSGTVKLADLGLARWGVDSTENSGEVHGTPQYISPEQLLSEPAGSTADMYSLGATFYHMLSGHYPFEGSNPTEYAEKHLFEPLKPLTEVVPGVPAAFSQVVEVMMAKRPGHRYVDMAELLQDLRRIGQGEPPLRPAHPKGQSPIDLEAGLGTDTPELEPVPAISPLLAAGAEGVLTIRPSGDPLAEDLIGEGELADEAGVDVDSVAEPKRGLAPIVMVVLALLALGGASAYYLLVVKGGTAAGGDEVAGSERTTVDELANIRQLVSSGAAEGEVADALGAYAQEHGLAGLDDAFWQLAGNYVQADLDTAREEARTTQLAAWQDEHEKALAAEAARKAEAERQAAAEAARLARDKEAQAQAAKEKAERDKRLAQMDKVRWQAVELCRRNEYSSAEALFVALAQSEDEQLAAWAKEKKASIGLAKKLYERVYNSKEALAGAKIPRAGSTKPWVVTYIGPKTIDAEFWRTTGYKDGAAVREKTEESFELDKLDERVISYLLVQIAAANPALSKDELQREFGAFLVSRAHYLPVAKQRLSGLSGAEAMIAEIEELAKKEESK